MFIDLDGQLNAAGSAAATDSSPRGKSRHTSVHHQTGVASDFLTKRGFGWLMDEELDEEDQLPLL